MFLIFLHGKEVKIKVFISPQKLTRHFFPLILSTPSYSLPLKPLQEVVICVAGRQIQERLERHQTMNYENAVHCTTFTFQIRQTQ